MWRRDLLGASALVTAAVAGCLGAFGDDYLLENELQPVVSALFDAFEAGDREAVDALVVDGRESDVIDDEGLMRIVEHDFAYEIDELSLDGTDGDHATVFADVTIFGTFYGTEGKLRRATFEIELHREDDEWVVWGFWDGNRVVRASVEVDQETDGDELVAIRLRLVNADRLDAVTIAGMNDCDGYAASLDDLRSAGDEQPVDPVALAEHCEAGDLVEVRGEYDGEKAILDRFDLEGDPAP